MELYLHNLAQMEYDLHPNVFISVESPFEWAFYIHGVCHGALPCFYSKTRVAVAHGLLV